MQYNVLPEDIPRFLLSEEWSNAACCGYVILACNELGYSEQRVHDILSAMYDKFESYSVKQAKEKYMRS